MEKEQQADIGFKKTLARLMAVQALYSLEMTGELKDTLETMSPDDAAFFQQIAHGETDEGGLELVGKLRNADKSFFRRIVVGVAKILPQADKQIEEHLGKGWSLPRLGALKLCLLRAAAYELYAEPKVPAEVVMSEYVNIASILLEAGDIKFVNGILQSLAATIRKEA